MTQGQLRAILGSLQRAAGADGGLGDIELLERWRAQRDSAAFELLVWRHGTMVWNACRRILVCESDVEDAFQATFLTLIRKANSIGQGRFLGSWLYKVAYRIALATRAASETGSHQELPADVAEDSTKQERWDELRPILDEEVNRLPEKYRRPFILCYLDGRTTDEAARDLGCPRGTIGTRLAWARERLRTRLTRRGIVLTLAGLTSLLTEKAAPAEMPLQALTGAVKAAAFMVPANAVAAGWISVRAVTLCQGVLQHMSKAKLNTLTLALFAVIGLGTGAGLLTHYALAGPDQPETSADQSRIVVRSGESELQHYFQQSSPSQETIDEIAIDDLATGHASESSLKDKEIKGEAARFSGTVVKVGEDGKSLSLAVASKGGNKANRRDIRVTDKTELVFSRVGLGEARLTEGAFAEVWVEKGSDDKAARIQMIGRGVPTKVPHVAGRVTHSDADRFELTNEPPNKPSTTLSTTVGFTPRTRISFSNVGRGGARLTPGYQSRVWLEAGSPDRAQFVSLIGSAEERPADKTEKKADYIGRIVEVDTVNDGLTLELTADKRAKPVRIQIGLTNATRESYYDVLTDAAKPQIGYRVQVWLAEGSSDKAARVRFIGDDPRKRVDGRILAISTQGDWFTMQTSGYANGETKQVEIRITAETRLMFSGVGAGGAKLAVGYRVQGWLRECSEDLAEELTASGPYQFPGK